MSIETEGTKPLYLKLSGLLLIPALLLGIAALYILDTGLVYEPRHLVGITNTTFASIIPLMVAVLAARVHLKTGSLGVLLMGCGMLGFGLCAGSAGWSRELPDGPNLNVTLYNVGSLLGSFCHVVGAGLSSFWRSPRPEPWRRKSAVITAYLVVSLFAVLFMFAAVQGVVPVFFIQGHGPTMLRQVVLGLAILFYALASLFFMNNYLRVKSDFLYWYSLCLAMFGVGLFAFYLQTNVGSPLSWLGRASTYIGTICSVAAVLAAFRSGKSGELPLEEVIVGYFVDAEANYRLLVETASDAIFSFDREKRVILWNTSAEQIFGYSKKEVIGSPVFGTLIPEEYEHALTSQIDAPRDIGSRNTIEIAAVRRGGELFQIEISVFGRKVPGGRVSTCIVRDITERRCMERALQKAKEEAERRAGELEALMDAVPAFTLIARDPQCDLVTGSRAMYELLRVPKGTNLSMSVPEVSPGLRLRIRKDGVDVSKDKLPLYMATRGREVRNYEMELAFEDGESRTILGNAAPLLDAAGEPYGALGAFVDITERKRLEEELRKSRDELELRVQERARELLAANEALREKAELIDIDHDAIITRDPDSRIVFWSRGAAETYGFTADEAVGRMIHELLKTVSPVPLEEINRTLNEAGEWKGELQHTRANGERVVVDSIQVRREGERAGFLEVNRDISARKVLEEAFRKADRALRTLSECNQTMVRQPDEMELLRQVCRIVVNVGGYRMAWVGIAEEDENKTVLPVASAGYDFGYLDEANVSWADTERGRGPSGTAIRTGRIVVAQNALSNPSYALWRAEGSRRGFASSISLPLNVDNRIIGALMIYSSEPDAFDLGEARHLSNLAENLAYGISSIRVAEQRRRSEEELKQYASRLEVINRELEDFAFVASHDLQEPLRKIQTFCDLVVRRCAPELDDAGKDYLNRIENSADRMRKLLRDLLDFSRVAARLEHCAKIDLEKVVREAADIFESSIRETDCRIEIENIPSIEADESQMLRLFQNLIGNALKFRGEEAPRIRVYGKTEKKRTCEICVEDNGIGFGQQFADRIFKPFQRLHDRNRYRGTGMGLAICRKIVERHGGTIRAESEPGKGSRFIIRLPLKHAGGGSVTGRNADRH